MFFLNINWQLHEIPPPLILSGTKLILQCLFMVLGQYDYLLILLTPQGQGSNPGVAGISPLGDLAPQGEIPSDLALPGQDLPLGISAP